MPSKILLILLAIVLSSCLNVPTAPVIPACSLVAIDGTEAYLYCINSDNSGSEWRIPVVGANKYICTSPDGYMAGLKYQKELEQYISQNCTSSKAKADER